MTTSIIYIVFCVNFLYFLTQCVAQQDKLQALVVIFRHGARTPIDPYPTDPYSNQSYWPVGFGQLTNEGKQQHLELGKWLRKRYSNYIPLEYAEKYITIRSTDVDRTLMSAEANLAGLYPPDQSQTFDPSLKWQPIPIHTIPEKSDALLAAKKPCPAYDYYYKKLFQTDYFKNISHENHDLFAYLTKYSGRVITTLANVEYLYNTLQIETTYNFKLPEWTNNVFPGKMRPLAELSFSTMTYTPQLARLKVGLLFNEIIDYLKNRSDVETNAPLVKFYSAHDTTIANVLNTMGSLNPHSPPFAATIMFEMYQNSSTNDSYLKIFYKNTSLVAYRIPVRECEINNCSLNKFIHALEPVTLNLDEWEMECASWNIYLRNSALIVGVVSVVFLFIIVVVLFVVLIKSRGNEDRIYTKLPAEEYT